MSDENTARHAECTVEFNGTDITSSIMPYLLSLSFIDNEEDASDDLQIKLQDRDGIWMESWLQKMIDGDVSAASSDGYKVGDVVQFLGGPHYKASTNKKANGNPKAGPAKITIINRVLCIHTTSSTPMAHPVSTAGWMPVRSPANLAAVLLVHPLAAEKEA